MSGFKQQIGTDETIGHIPKFGGEIWFVNKNNGSDTNTGREPDNAFETIGAAISASAAGDAITIAQGTYSETGIDVNKSGLELWFNIGALIDPASGTALTVSGASCKILGEVKITPNSAVGVLVSGNECVLEDIKVLNATDCYQITGSGSMLNKCSAGFPSSGNCGFSIMGDQTKLQYCSTVGNTTSYGYKINNGADTGVISKCSSVGHQTSGFYIDTLSQDWTILNCSSGASDGKAVDVDNTNVWSNYTFDNKVYKSITFTTTGTQTYNLFRVYGTVLVDEINGFVSTVISSNMTAFHLESWDGTTAVDITKNDGVISALPVGSFIVKEDKFDKTLAIVSAASGALQDEWDAKKAAFSITEKTGGVPTYIRLSCTSTDSPPSGSVDWSCSWYPKTNDGFLEAV